MPSVLIDPGHGPGNPNRGPTSYREYEGMWRLSNFLKDALTRSGIRADLTRKEHEDPALYERGRMAEGYDVFISEHSNAAGEEYAGKLSGAEVYYSIRQPKNRTFAADLSYMTAISLGIPDNGAKKRPSVDDPTRDYYAVIRNAVEVGCPHAFLSEAAYHDNPVEEALLLKDDNLRRVAEAQAEVICRFLDVAYIPPE